jgi:hypothetical protein
VPGVDELDLRPRDVPLDAGQLRDRLPAVAAAEPRDRLRAKALRGADPEQPAGPAAPVVPEVPGPLDPERIEQREHGVGRPPLGDVAVGRSWSAWRTPASAGSGGSSHHHSPQGGARYPSLPTSRRVRGFPLPGADFLSTFF